MARLLLNPGYRIHEITLGRKLEKKDDQKINVSLLMDFYLGVLQFVV